MKTSAVSRSWNKSSRPASLRMSRHMLRLLRFTERNHAASPLRNGGPHPRASSPRSGSILMTSAPMSARYIDAVGRGVRRGDVDHAHPVLAVPCPGGHDPLSAPCLGRVAQDVLEVLVHGVRRAPRRSGADRPDDGEVLLDGRAADLGGGARGYAPVGLPRGSLRRTPRAAGCRSVGDRDVEVAVVAPRCRRSSIVRLLWRSTMSCSDAKLGSACASRAAHEAAGTSSTRRIAVSSSMSSDPSRTMVSMDSLSMRSMSLV